MLIKQTVKESISDSSESFIQTEKIINELKERKKHENNKKI